MINYIFMLSIQGLLQYIYTTEQDLGAAMGGSLPQLSKAGFGVRLDLLPSPE